MDFHAFVTVLVVATCAVHILASPHAPLNSADQDLKNLLNELKNSLMHKEQEMIHQEAAEMMQMRRRCCTRSTRNIVRLPNMNFALECCIANGILCLNPTLNVPQACVNEEESTCKNIAWEISLWKTFTFQVCQEAEAPCLKNSPIMPCSRDLTNKANTASVVLCHDEEDGREDCTSDGDINSDTALSQMLDRNCFCIEGDLGLPICNPKGCKPSSMLPRGCKLVSP